MKTYIDRQRTRLPKLPPTACENSKAKYQQIRSFLSFCNIQINNVVIIQLITLLSRVALLENQNQNQIKTEQQGISTFSGLLLIKILLFWNVTCTKSHLISLISQRGLFKLFIQILSAPEVDQKLEELNLQLSTVRSDYELCTSVHF